MKSRPPYRPLAVGNPPGASSIIGHCSTFEQLVTAIGRIRQTSTATGYGGQTSVIGRKLLITAPFRFDRTVQLEDGDSGLVIEVVGQCPMESPVDGSPCFALYDSPNIRIIGFHTAPGFQSLAAGASGTALLHISRPHGAVLNIQGLFSVLTVTEASQCTGAILASAAEYALVGSADSPLLDVTLTSACVILAESLLRDVTVNSASLRTAACKVEDLTLDGSNGLLSSTSYATLTDNGTNNRFSPVAVTAADVTIGVLGSPTYDDLQDMHDLVRSAGHLTGGDVTNGGVALVNVSAGTGLVRTMGDDTSPLLSFDWGGATGLSVPPNTVRYIKVAYNGGTPVVTSESTENYDYRTSFPLGFVINDDGVLYINNTPHSVGRGLGRLMRRNYEVEGRSRASGLVISENGAPLRIGLTAGVTWLRGLREDVAAVDTSLSGTFDLYYRDGVGGWSRDSGEVAIPNGLFDNNGPTPTITNNRYANYWMYLGASSGLVMVMGRVNENLIEDAASRQPPSDLPPRLRVGALFLGRFIVQRTGGSTYTVVQTDSTADFVFNGVPTVDLSALYRLDGTLAMTAATLAGTTGDIAGPSNGQLWYNTSTNKFRGRENGASVDVIGGGGGGGGPSNVDGGTPSDPMGGGLDPVDGGIP